MVVWLLCLLAGVLECLIGCLFGIFCLAGLIACLLWFAQVLARLFACLLCLPMRTLPACFACFARLIWLFDPPALLACFGYLICVYARLRRLLASLLARLRTCLLAVQVACGLYHTACVTTAGQAFSWGGNESGQVCRLGRLKYDVATAALRSVFVFCVEACSHALFLSPCRRRPCFRGISVPREGVEAD